MNKKGFTVVEMGLSFCLIFTICILLFQVVLSLKEIYIRSDVETTLLNKQGIMLNKIYKDLESKRVQSVEACNVYATACVKFNFLDGTYAQLYTSNSGKKITYDNYTWELDDASIGEIQIVKNLTNEKTYFSLQISVTNSLLDEKDYGLDIVYIY